MRHEFLWFPKNSNPIKTWNDSKETSTMKVKELLGYQRLSFRSLEELLVRLCLTKLRNYFQLSSYRLRQRKLEMAIHAAWKNVWHNKLSRFSSSPLQNLAKSNVMWLELARGAARSLFLEAFRRTNLALTTCASSLGRIGWQPGLILAWHFLMPKGWDQGKSQKTSWFGHWSTSKDMAPLVETVAMLAMFMWIVHGKTK